VRILSNRIVVTKVEDPHAGEIVEYPTLYVPHDPDFIEVDVVERGSASVFRKGQVLLVTSYGFSIAPLLPDGSGRVMNDGEVTAIVKEA
jgi:hypothetical protein